MSRCQVFHNFIIQEIDFCRFQITNQLTKFLNHNNINQAFATIQLKKLALLHYANFIPYSIQKSYYLFTNVRWSGKKLIAFPSRLHLRRQK